MTQHFHGSTTVRFVHSESYVVDSRSPYCGADEKTADEIINCDAQPFRMNLSDKK